MAERISRFAPVRSASASRRESARASVSFAKSLRLSAATLASWANALETCTAQLSLPTILFGSRVQPSERGCHCGQRIRLRLLLLLLLRLLLLLLLQLLLYFLLLLLLLLQLLLLLLHLLLNLLLKLLLLLLHLHY